MAKIQNKAKRVLAVTIALMMVLGACFTGMATASAESLTDGLTAVATVDTDGGNYDGFNGFRTITGIDGGGITYASTGDGARSPYVHNVATSIPGNGVVLQFDGYSSDPTDESAPTSYGYRSIMIVLGTCPNGNNTDRANYRLAADNAGIVIDTANGHIKYVKGTDSTYIGGFSTVKWVVTDSDVIKYENIANKPFTVALNPAEDGAIEVVVTVNGTDSVAGTITAEEYASIANATTENITFGICAVEGGSRNIQPMTINYYGYKKVAGPSLADGLTAVATTATDSCGVDSTATTVTDVSESGGVNISTTGYGGYLPYVHNVGIGKFPHGGVTLQFDGFTSSSSESNAGTYGYQSMLIVLSNSSSSSDAYRLRSADVPAFVIDAYNGDLNFVVGVDGAQNSYTLVETVIDDNDLIKYANITNVPFTVTFNYNADGDITVDVAVTGNNETGTASGVLSANKYASVANTKTKLTYFALSSLEGSGTRQAISFNYYGYKTLGLAPEFVSDLTSVSTLDKTAGYFEKNSGWGAVTQGDVTYGMVGDLSGGGVYLDVFQHAGYGSLVLQENLGGWNANWEILLGNYRATGDTTDEGYGKIAIAFQAGSAVGDSTIYDNSIFLGIDTTVGTLSLLQATTRNGRVVGTVNTLATIATDDALKVENIQGKLFKVRWSQTLNPEDVKVSVIFSDKTVTGTFAKALLSTVAVEGGKTGYSMTATAAYPALANIYGTTANAVVGQEQWDYQLFINLYGINTNIVPDYMVETRAQAQALADNYYSSADSVYYNDQLTITDLQDAEGNAAGAAMKFTYSGYNPFVTNNSLGEFPAFTEGGYEFVFANYKDESSTSSSGYRTLYFQFINSKAGSNYYLAKSNQRGIQIDTDTGSVDFTVSYDEGYRAPLYFTLGNIIQDDALLYDNLTAKAFTVGFTNSTREGAEQYETKLSITIYEADGTSTVVTGYIPYSYLIEDISTRADEIVAGFGEMDYNYTSTKENLFPSDGSASYLCFSPYGNAASNVTIDFIGYNTLLPEYITDARNNIDVVASLEATPDGREYENSAATETDVRGGGVFISGMSGYDSYNIAHNFGGWPGDGLKLQFANFVTTDTSDDNAYKFALMLGNTSSNSMQAWKGGNVMIIVDGVAGQVDLVKCYTQQLKWATVATLIDNDAFLYENFTGKAFSFEFKLSGRKSNEVQMDIDLGGTIYTGYIDYATMMATTAEDGTSYGNAKGEYYYPTGTTLYVGFGGMDNTSRCDFYFLGYTDGVTPDYMTAAQESVATTVTVDDNVYTAGKEDDKPSTPDFISNIEGGGVHYQAIGHYPFQLQHGMGCWPGNGFKLQFANYAEASTKTTAAGYGQFVVFFNYGINNNSTYGPFWKGGNVGFNINTVAGQVELVKSDFKGLSTDGTGTGANSVKYVQDVLVKDDMFLYENFAGTVFSYEILPAGFDNTALVKITVGEKTVSFTITYDELTYRPDNFVTNEYYPKTTWDGETSNCNVSFSGLLHDGTIAAVDFIGYTQYDDTATLTVDTVTASAGDQVAVPVYATAEAASMQIEVDAAATIDAIDAADGVELAIVIDGDKAIVDVLSTVTGTNAKLFDVMFTVGTDAVYTVDTTVVSATDAEGNAIVVKGGKGAAVVTTVTPDANETKYQATEGAYQIGTLGFGTSTADMAALATEDFVAVEFGTVFFTKSMLGDQELKIGTTKVGGTATALTVSKKIADGETLPEMFVAILKDKASNTSDTVSDGYRNTTYVARSFVRYYDKVNAVYVIIYGNTREAKLADLA